MDRSYTFEELDAATSLTPEQVKEQRARAEKSTFDYWLKAPAWGATNAATLLELRFAEDGHDDDGVSINVDCLIIGLLRHFQRFGLIDRICRNSDGKLEVPNTKLPPSEWIKCYRDYPGAKPLPFDDPTPAIRATSPGPEKPLKPNERNSLLTIIAALCEHASIKHQDRGAAGRIARMSENIGAAVSEDTVRRVLAQIPDAMASRMK